MPSFLLILFIGSAAGAGDAGVAAASPFKQNWLDFGKFGWIWAKVIRFRQI